MNRISISKAIGAAVLGALVGFFFYKIQGTLTVNSATCSASPCVVDIVITGTGNNCASVDNLDVSKTPGNAHITITWNIMTTGWTFAPPSDQLYPPFFLKSGNPSNAFHDLTGAGTKQLSVTLDRGHAKRHEYGLNMVSGTGTCPVDPFIYE